MPKVLFVHTLALLADTFNKVAADQMPSVERVHIVDEPLLARIRARKRITDDDVERLQGHIELAEDVGAGVVLVTCSTLSPCVEKVLAPEGTAVVPIDGPMIAKAVQGASRLAIVATNPATLEPTRQAVLAAAAQAGKELDIEEVLRAEALDAYQQEDFERHDRLVAAAAVEALSNADLVMLAQATMARALPAVPTEHRTRILTSPEAAVARVRELLLQ